VPQGPRGLPVWQWAVVALLFVAAWIGGWVLGRLANGLARKLAARTAHGWDDLLLDRLAGPLTLLWTLLLVGLALPWLDLHASAEGFVQQVQRGGLFVAFFWMLARGVDAGAKLLARSPWAAEHPASRSLVPLGARAGKVFVLALAAVAVLSVLGYPVASLLAGLGIGGLAFALAAQKTVENLFGAFSIGADQPFRIGDFVKIEDFTGTVETIGLRSTRVRTLDRTLITIPNGKLAEMRLESFSVRDRLRFACVLRLSYATTEAQMRAVLAGVERALRALPKVSQHDAGVAFTELGESFLKVEVNAWFETQDWNEFQRVRQDALLQFMNEVSRAGTSFAFPARSIYVMADGGRPTDKRSQAQA